MLRWEDAIAAVRAARGPGLSHTLLKMELERCVQQICLFREQFLKGF